MKTLTKYLNEKLIIFPSQVDEKLVINKDYHYDVIVPKSFNELRKIIEDRYNELGPGTKDKPVDFNDVDVSNSDSFCNINEGIFDGTKFEYIDISYWNVSNVKNMKYMFENSRFNGDISGWDVSKVESMTRMFQESVFNKDISNWDVSKVKIMDGMFSYSPLENNPPKWYKE